MTLTFSSSYRRTAFVFSSWAGTGTLTRACIQPGASARTGRAEPRMAIATKDANFAGLIACACLARLQNNLLFISSPHDLKEISQCGVVLCTEHQQIKIEFANQVNGPFIAINL